MSQLNIRIQPLERDNYDTWKVQVKALLTKGDAWGYVSGEIQRPAEGEAAILQWRNNDAKAMSDLILSISPAELKHVKTCETSKEIWTKLQSIHESQGPARKAMLLKSLIHAKMKDGDDMHSHLANFLDVVGKLEDLDLKINPELTTILMLYSVPENYEPFRVAIETREKLPTPEELKIKLLEEFQSRKRSAEEASTTAMFVSKQNKPKGQNTRNSAEKGDERKEIKCFKCKKTGHFARYCKKQSGTEKKNSEESKCAEVAMNACGVTGKEEPPTTKVTRNIVDSQCASVAMKACTTTEKTEPSTNTIVKPHRWCLDSGASSHMCRDQSAFEEINEQNRLTLNLATMDSTKIQGTGIVKLNVSDKVTAVLKNTLFVPNLRSNLLSVAKITDYGHEVTFKKDGATIVNKDNEKIFEAKRVENLYVINDTSEIASIANIKENPWQNLHENFGHLNMKDLKYLVNRECVHGIKVTGDEKMPTCEVCVQGKLARIPFDRSNTISSETLQLVHTDICGPMRVQSLSGSRYFVTLIDDKTRYCEVLFMKNKSDIFEKFVEYKTRVEKQTGKKIKIVRSDNGREYLSDKFKDLFKREGIIHELTAEYTPEQNGVAERFNRTLVEMARCMLLQSKLPPTFWAEAVMTACYIRNRCPTRALNGGIPYTAWTTKIPTVAHFKTFGVVAHMLEKGKNLGKFDPRSRKCIFIGYSLESKAYRLWDPVARKVLKSRDVKFLKVFQENESEASNDFIDIELITNSCNRENLPQNENEELHDENERHDCSEDEDNDAKAPAMKPGRGRPKIIRTGKPGRPAKKKQEVPITPRENDNESEESWEDATIAEVESYENNEEFAGFICIDPICAEQALRLPEADEWKRAMREEIEALVANKTWTIVERPKEKKIIGSKWVLRTKLNQDGSVMRRKARLVAKGFSQRKDVDYFETFAPVARLESIRTVMALAVEKNLEVHQLDFVSAYLNGEIKEEIYLEVPDLLSKIMEDDHLRKSYENKVLCLNKALYGLKQSGRCWFMKLDEKLKEMSFKQLSADHCVYYQRDKRQILSIIVIYVDDLIVASSSEKRMRDIKRELSTFKMKDLGRIDQCLGIKFHQDQESNQISMSQEGFIENIIQKFNMEDCKPVQTPLNPSVKLSKAMSPKNEEERKEMSSKPYRSLIGSLMYLAISTRPDITHAISQLSQFNEDPGPYHWTAAKRVLRYLKGTKDLKLIFKKTEQKLEGYADADWGNNADDRHSYTGYFFKLANAAISWSSRKQKSIALSSTEAEYVSLSEAAKEAMHIRKFLGEISGCQEKLTIFNDNQGAGQMTKNPINHGRAKHIDIRFHHIREVVDAGVIKVEYQPTEKMPADVLTKALATVKHNKCVKEMGLNL